MLRSFATRRSGSQPAAAGALRNGLAAIGLFLLALAGPGSAAEQARFDYLYIVANEEGSSGGHAAIRLDGFVYHFQNEEGLLVLQRDRAEDFLFDYALVENRTIHASRVEVSPQALSAIVERFRTRHRAQEAQIETARALTRDRILLEALGDGGPGADAFASASAFAIPGLAYFDSDLPPSQARPPWMIELVSASSLRSGPDVLVRRRAELMEGLRALLEEEASPARVRPPSSVYDHPAFERALSSRWLDLVSGLAALDVLEQGSPLDPAFAHAPGDERFALEPGDIDALGRFAEVLRNQLLDLVDSRRSDWGQAVLVALARLGAVHRSIETGQLVFLDSFPDGADLGSSTIDPESAVTIRLLAENRRQFEVSLAYFRELAQPDELAWERLEERSNRYLEMSQAVRGTGRLRVAKGHLVPAHARFHPISVSFAGDADVRSERLERARVRERDYLRRMRALHRYGLVSRNCVTAIFETLNESFGNSVELSQAALGGHIDGRRSLSFIPFVSASRVDGRYRVVAHETIWSYRQARLREMRETEDPVWLALRESNTLSATSYRRRSADSFFLFFTDETVWLRPVLGAFNLVAGLGESLVGLVTAPVDRGRTLTRGLRGTFVSLPELAFWNIRKGSNDWIPPEHRDLSPRVVAAPSNHLAGALE